MYKLPTVQRVFSKTNKQSNNWLWATSHSSTLEHTVSISAKFAKIGKKKLSQNFCYNHRRVRETW